MSNDISWAFFHLLCPLLISCHLVDPFGLVGALPFSRRFVVAPVPTPRAVARSGGWVTAVVVAWWWEQGNNTAQHRDTAKTGTVCHRSGISATVPVPVKR
jgi:hypothetical protein